MTRVMLGVLSKDLLIERRSKAGFNALIFLAALILVIISFSLGPSSSRLQSVAGGVLWIAFAFAAVLAFGRAFQSETENRSFEGMLLTGADPKAIYLGKVLAATVLMLVVEIVVGLAMSLLYGLDLWARAPALFLVAVLGTIGLTAIGILYGRLTMSLRAREVMLPLLVLPVVVPVILAAVEASQTLTVNGSTSGLWLWLELLAVFDTVFLTAGLLTFESLCEE